MTQAFNAKTRLSARLGARRAGAGRRGRVAGAGPAGTLQRLPDRGRRRRHGVRRGRAHDDARGRPRRRQARRHQPGRARPRRTPIIAAPRRRSACPCSATPRRCEDAEGSGGFRYWPQGLARLRRRCASSTGCCTARVGRRAGEDRRHAQRGRRGGRLPRDRPPRPRPGADRPVARVRPPRAGQRLLLHARHVGPRLPAAPAGVTTTTPSRRARASASSPRWSPRPRGQATPSP